MRSAERRVGRKRVFECLSVTSDEKRVGRRRVSECLHGTIGEKGVGRRMKLIDLFVRL